MTLFWKELKYRRKMAIGCCCVLVCMFLIVRGDPQTSRLSFVWFFEEFYSIIALALFSLLYYSRDEIELTVSSPTPTARVFFTKAAAIYFISAVIYIAALPVSVTRGHILIEHSGYVMLSYLVVLLFLGSIALLLRLVLNNAYLSVPLMLLLILKLHGWHGRLVYNALGYHLINENYRYIDPFYTDLVLRYTPEALSNGGWIANRLILTGIALIFLLGSYLMLRRDRLHNQ